MQSSSQTIASSILTCAKSLSLATSSHDIAELFLPRILTFRSLLSPALNNAMPLHSCPATGAELAELPEALCHATVRAFDNDVSDLTELNIAN